MAEDSFSDGCKAVADNNLDQALKIFTKLLEENDKDDKVYSCRAEVHLKLEKFEDAKSDAKKSIENGNVDSKTYLSYGTACFSLKQFEEAEEAFKNGKEKSADNVETFDCWLEKCKLELQSLVPKKSSSQAIKKDWYQTETDIVLSVMIKDLKSEDVKVEILSDSIIVDAKLPDSEECTVTYNLAHAIVPQKSSWKVLRTKLEIKLKKETGGRWEKLEDLSATNSNNSGPISASLPTYPSSSAAKKDWNEIGKEINKMVDEDKPEGDAALNELFQKIYKDGDDNLRRAMNKSFMESGGTVLSTNWSEVGDKEVEVKAPDGMEFKKWS